MAAPAVTECRYCEQRHDPEFLCDPARAVLDALIERGMRFDMPTQAKRWRPVPGYEGLYEVSNGGDIWSIPRCGRRGRLLAQSPRRGGYRTVGLWRDGVEKTHLVHILVMRAFAGEPSPGMQTRHLDGNPANNRWAPGDAEDEVRANGGNLFYGTPPENGQDKILHGTAVSGEQNGRHKLTVADVRELHRRRRAGASMHSLSRQFGVSRPMVRRIVSGNAWRSEFLAAAADEIRSGVEIIATGHAPASLMCREIASSSER